MNLRLILGGMKSLLPLPAARFKGTGGTDDALYCYSIWARHLTLISEYLGRRFAPKNVVEIGPGDSIGVGVAAVLSGAETYTALDVVPHCNTDRTSRILSELVELFRAEAPVGDDNRFPKMYPRLEIYGSPRELWNEDGLNLRLSPSDVEGLRREIERLGRHDRARLNYCSPWSMDSVTPSSSDHVFSQVALQDMDHSPGRDVLANNFRAMVRWLEPGGVMSHQIDFACPGGQPWNHHWTHDRQTWAIIRGRRPYYVNRVSLSTYVRMIEDNDCEIVGLQKITSPGIPRSRAARPFRDLPDEDFHTSGAFIVAVKR